MDFSSPFSSLFGRIARIGTAFRHLPHILRPSAWYGVVALALLAIVSGVGLLFISFGFHLVEVPRHGGTYTEGILGTPARVNPLFAFQNAADLDVTRLVYSGLVRVETEQTIVPDLAEQFTVSPDTLTYTFRLRSDAQWHDGKPVTADDVVFTIERVQDPALLSPLARQFDGVTIIKIDATTIQFTLKEAFAPFLESLSVGILPKHVWQDIPVATMAHSGLNVRPIGSGPYAFDSLVKDERRGIVRSYTLKAFPNYYGDFPYIETLRLRFYETALDAFAAFERGDIEGLGMLPGSDIQTAPTRATVFPLPLSQYTALFFNQERNAALKDRKVREALAHAVDREALIDDVLGGAGTPIAGPILLGALGFTTDVAAYPFDRTRAETLLDEASWKRMSVEEFRADAEAGRQAKEVIEGAGAASDTTRTLRDVEGTIPPPKTEAMANAALESENDRTLPYYRKRGDVILTIQLATADVPENRHAAEQIRAAWEAIGVRTVLDIRADNIQQEVIQPRAYDVLLFGIRLGRDPDPFSFWHSTQAKGTGANLALYANATVDTLLEDARRTDDADVRAAKYAEFQRIITKDLPAHFLYTPNYIYMLDQKVRGFEATRIAKPSDRFVDIVHWFVDTRSVLTRTKT